MVFCAALNCLNNFKSKVSTFKFPANSKVRKQWLFKMKRKEFKPDKNSRICAVHFTEDCFRENLAVNRFLGSDFKPLRLHLKEDAVPTIYFFGKGITEKNAFQSTKTPLSVRQAFCTFLILPRAR